MAGGNHQILAQKMYTVTTVIATRNTAKERATEVEPRSGRLLSIVSAPGSDGPNCHFGDPKSQPKTFVPDVSNIGVPERDIIYISRRNSTIFLASIKITDG